jgi:mannose-6-phosphate isomerase-like protein (cupin superfamily)
VHGQADHGQADHGQADHGQADQRFETRELPAARDGVAPDGSDVRVLLGLGRGSMAHFELAAGQVSLAVAHHTVDELWYILNGQGEMWRRQGEQEETVVLRPGTCLSIPVGTRFQFRADDSGPLAAVGVTMPPWPGDGEAYPVPGTWPAMTPPDASPGNAVLPGGFTRPRQDTYGRTGHAERRWACSQGKGR